MDARATKHISELINRLVYLEEIEAEHGPHKVRGYERDALEWVLGDVLAIQYPDETQAAEVRAEQLAQNRRKKSGHGSR